MSTFHTKKLKFHYVFDQTIPNLDLKINVTGLKTEKLLIMSNVKNY